MAQREDAIANAVRFLHNESVRGKPEHEKLEFMKKKGLSDAEITEALHRAAGGSASSTTPPPGTAPVSVAPAPAVTQPLPGPPYDPMMYPPHYPPQQYVPPPIYYAPPSKETPWWKMMLGLAGALGVGFAASTYYRQQHERGSSSDERHRSAARSQPGQVHLTEYATPQRAVEKEASLALEPVREVQVESSANSNFESLEELLKQQAKDHKDMMQRLLESNRQQAQAIQQLTQKVAQLSLNQTIKPQADLSDASLHVLQEVLIDALRAKEDSADQAPVDETQVEKIRSCLKVISEESETKEEARKSLGMLSTILENLRRHPENEKYRKVNTTSNRFKDRFSAKQRADEFFTTLGFESSGPNFIFPAGPISNIVHKAMGIISDMSKNLDDNWVRGGDATPVLAVAQNAVPPTVAQCMPWASSALHANASLTPVHSAGAISSPLNHKTPAHPAGKISPVNSMVSVPPAGGTIEEEQNSITPGG